MNLWYKVARIKQKQKRVPMQVHVTQKNVSACAWWRHNDVRWCNSIQYTTGMAKGCTVPQCYFNAIACTIARDWMMNAGGRELGGEGETELGRVGPQEGSPIHPTAPKLFHRWYIIGRCWHCLSSLVRSQASPTKIDIGEPGNEATVCSARQGFVSCPPLLTIIWFMWAFKFASTCMYTRANIKSWERAVSARNIEKLGTR